MPPPCIFCRSIYFVLMFVVVDLSILGAAVIVVGLYSVVWGKSKEARSSASQAPTDEKAGGSHELPVASSTKPSIVHNNNMEGDGGMLKIRVSEASSMIEWSWILMYIILPKGRPTIIHKPLSLSLYGYSYLSTLVLQAINASWTFPYGQVKWNYFILISPPIYSHFISNRTTWCHLIARIDLFSFVYPTFYLVGFGPRILFHIPKYGGKLARALGASR